MSPKWTKLPTLHNHLPFQHKPTSSSSRQLRLGSSAGDLGIVRLRMARSDQDWPSDSSPGLAFHIAVVLWHLGWTRAGYRTSWDPSVGLEGKGSHRPWPPWVWGRATGESVKDSCLDGSRRWGSGYGRGLSGWTSYGSNSPPRASSWKTKSRVNEGTSRAKIFRGIVGHFSLSLFTHHNVVPYLCCYFFLCNTKQYILTNSINVISGHLKSY